MRHGEVQHDRSPPGVAHEQSRAVHADRVHQAYEVRYHQAEVVALVGLVALAVTALVGCNYPKSVSTELRSNEVPDVTARTQTVYQDNALGCIPRTPLLKMQAQASHFDEAHRAKILPLPSPPTWGVM